MNDPTVPSLSVLIPTHGRGETLRHLLDALARQTLPAQRFQVVVVDDGSPEPVRLDAGRYPYELVLLRQAQAGPGAARNHGLQHCRAELLLILNDDAVPAEDLLERHLAAHREVPPRSAVLGTFHFTEAARRSPFVRLLDESSLLFDFPNLRDGHAHGWQFFWTCNLSLPTQAVREVGGFDSERFDSAIVEDVELGYRLAKNGWSVVYREECRAEHDHVLEPAGYFQRAERLGCYLHRMWRKHGDPHILWRATHELALATLNVSVTVAERYRKVEGALVEALERLEGEFAGGLPMPASVVEQTVALIREVGMGAYYRGLHREATGIDILETMRDSAPAGTLTSVVIVSCNQVDHTRRCLEALRAAREERLPIELIVVDNGSTDGSAEWLAQQADVHLIANRENLGAPHARNQALVHCHGDWIAFLDNDVFVPPGWLSRALYHGVVDPHVGAVPLVANRASKLQQVPYQGGSDPESIARAAEERFRSCERTGQDADLFTSLAVLVRREVVEEIGGFDERFSPWGFEDDDLALRVRYGGWRNRVALDTFVYHAPYPDEAKRQRHGQHLHDNWARFAAKWGTTGTTPPMFDYEGLRLNDRTEVEYRVPIAGLGRRHSDALRVEKPAIGAPPAIHTAPPAHQPADPGVSTAPAGAHDVVVVGSGRSGTSLLTGLLAHAGWFVGDDPYPGRPANPKGFFETAEVNGLNEELLAAADPSGRPAGHMQRWLTVPRGEVAVQAAAAQAQRMRALTSRQPFAFKDPRFCSTLPAWRPALGDARFVCVFREPAATAESILRECGEADYLRGVDMTFERALEVWCASYARVLERHRHEGQWMFVHFDQLLTPNGLARLEAFVGAPVARDFPDAALSRSRGGRPVTEEAARLYRELCTLAGHPARELELAPASQACTVARNQPSAIPPATVPSALSTAVRRAPAPTPDPIPTSAGAAHAPTGALDLSVIVCTYQRLDTLRRCLASFDDQTAPHGTYEIVVVDDGCSDGTREWLDGWRPRALSQVVHQENDGLAAARNTGLGVARGRIVLLVNDDTIAHEGLVAAHLAAHAERGPRIAVLGTFEQPAPALDNALMRVLEQENMVFCYGNLEPGKLHDWTAFWTCNVSVAAEDVSAVGGFDTAFRHYGCEDTDLAFRLHQQRGVKVLFDDRARANHEHILSYADLARRNRTVARAWMRLFRKHPGTLSHPDWSRFRSHTRAVLERKVREAQASRHVLESAVGTLSAVDVGALERLGPQSGALARDITSTLAAKLRTMNELWWTEGQVDALEEFGADSVATLVRPAEEAAQRPAVPRSEPVATLRPVPAPPVATAAPPPREPAPWPLATRARERYLAWPRYDRPDDLEHLLESWADALLDQPDRCLCLRHDPDVDGDLSAAIECLNEVYERVVGEGHALEVLMVDGEISDQDLPRLGRAVRAVLRVPGRDAWERQLGCRAVDRPAPVQ